MPIVSGTNEASTADSCPTESSFGSRAEDKPFFIALGTSNNTQAMDSMPDGRARTPSEWCAHAGIVLNAGQPLPGLQQTQSQKLVGRTAALQDLGEMQYPKSLGRSDPVERHLYADLIKMTYSVPNTLPSEQGQYLFSPLKSMHCCRGLFELSGKHWKGFLGHHMAWPFRYPTGSCCLFSHQDLDLYYCQGRRAK